MAPAGRRAEENPALCEAEGGRAVTQRVHGGRASKVTQEVRERLHKAFDGDASIKKAWEKLGKKGEGCWGGAWWGSAKGAGAGTRVRAR